MDNNNDFSIGWFSNLKSKMTMHKKLLFKLQGNILLKVLILGAGISGQSCVRWLNKFNCSIHIIDSRKLDLPNVEWCYDSFETEVNFDNYCDVVENFDMVVVSPGLSPYEGKKNNFYLIHQRAIRKDVPILTELDLFFLALEMQKKNDEKILAVTGTNGKTSVVSMLGSLLTKLGYDIQIAGNIGISLLQAYLKREKDKKLPEIWVIELSSFQLALTNYFRSDGSVILNFSDDHLDWHFSKEEYLKSKLKIFGYPLVQSTPIINSDEISLRDKISTHYKKNNKKKFKEAIHFGLDQKISFGVYSKETINDKEFFSTHDIKRKQIPILRLSEIEDIGVQNHINVLGCFSMASLVLKNLEELRFVSHVFKIPKHRLQKFFEFENLEFLDDSKSTNVEATIFALNSMLDPIYLILGGDLKGQKIDQLVTSLKGRDVCTFVYGKDRDVFEMAFRKKAIQCLKVKNIEQAVKLIKAKIASRSVRLTRKEKILLSPACASTDMFTNYAHRGESFKKAVFKTFGEDQHA